MISKAIALIMSVAGMILFLVGLFNGWPRHMIFGAVGIVGGLILVRLATGKSKWHYDGATHRRFKYLRTTSECPFCKESCIMMVSREESIGIWCNKHGFVWADLFAQYERWKAQEEE